MEALDRWATGLRIGLAAYRLSLPAGHRKNDRNFRIDLANAVAIGLSELGARDNVRLNVKNSALRSLPIQTLQIMASNALKSHLGLENELHAEISDWKSALDVVIKPRKEGQPPLVNSSKLLARLILDSNCSVHFLIQSGRIFVGDNWKWLERDKSWEEHAKETLTKLRRTGSYNSQIIDTFERIKALAEFRNAIPGQLQNWRLVENAIYHQLFSWPLLVFDTKGSESAGAFSIPVAVDVMFDNTAKVEIIGGVKVDADEWRSELAAAVSVAKELWRSKHGGLQFSFREIVQNARVKFDFHLADKIVDGLPFGLQLVDKSMGAYLAQVVLHRLLGRSTGFGGAITGQIGAQKNWPDGSKALDYEFDPVVRVPQKIRYVFDSLLFSKLVLPARATEGGNGSDEFIVKTNAYLDRVKGEPITEINYCANMSNVADAVQIQGWRQFHYIRCPDLVHALHRRPQNLPSQNDPEVDRVRVLLSTNTHPILKLPTDISITALLSYLRHVNFTQREALLPTPPMLSWGFIRATNDENDRRFWYTVWRLMGASRDDFTLFRHAVTSTAAATIFAEVLNTFSPRESCPSHRAPDLLVVMAAKRLEPTEWKKDGLFYRSHIFPSVIAALAQQDVLPTPIEKMREFIGATRIVVLDHGECDVGAERPPSMSLLDYETRKILLRLSTFQFGFTQQMASVLLYELGFGGSSVRGFLKLLTRRGYLGEGAGEYWVKGNIGATTISSSTDPLMMAEWHWAAARAFAPYLSGAAAPGLDYDTSFLPENVHEASFHLEEAADLAIKAKDLMAPSAKQAEDLRKSIRTAQARVFRFMELPSAGIVQQLTKDRTGLSSRAAWDMARELLEEKKKLNIAPTPLELIIYARAGCSWLEDTKNDPAIKTAREEMIKSINALYSEALKGTNGTASEDCQRRMGVLTNYGHYLAKFVEESGEVSKILKQVREEISQLINIGVRSATVEAKWFEIEGDIIENPEQAARCYRDGTKISPRYFTCWIKYAGALPRQASKSPDAAREFSELPLDVRHELYRWALRQRLPIKSGLDRPWIAARWHSGLEFLKGIVEQ